MGAEVFHLKFSSNSLGLKNEGIFFSLNISNAINLMKDLQLSASADYGNGLSRFKVKTQLITLIVLQ
jgi:hypothetical protein